MTALAELSAQWLTSRPDGEAAGGQTPGADQPSGAPFAWPSDAWSSSGESNAASPWVQQPSSGAHGDTFVDAVWEAAQQPIKQQELVAQRAGGQQRVGRPRRGGGSAPPPHDQNAPTEALPSLLLLALSPGPRARLLGEAMAAVRQEMQLQLAASTMPADASSNGDSPWNAAAQKTAAAAVLRAGAAWVMSYPQVAAQVAAEGALPTVAGGPAAGMALVAGSAAQLGGQEQQASGLAAALRAAGEAATTGDALGTRAVLYGALLRTMSQQQQARGVGVGHASGTLLSGASRSDAQHIATTPPLTFFSSHAQRRCCRTWPSPAQRR